MNNPSISDSQLVFKPDVADKFLSYFSYEIITLQLLAKSDSVAPAYNGKFLWNKQKGSSAVAYKSGLLLEQPFLADIFALQHCGLGVYFMVNEGDGIVHPPAYTPRSAQSLKKLKAIFVDTDNGDIKTVGNYLIEKKIVPHLIIESSPQKFHLYLLIEDTENTIENISKWKQLQEHLFKLDKNYDASMADPAKLLRLPGFYHTKVTPFLTHIVQDNTIVGLPKYNLDQLYNTFNLYKSTYSIGNSTAGTNGTFNINADLNGSKSPYCFPSGKIEEGSRHQELISFVRHASNHTTIKQDLVNAALGHAISFFKDYQPFLPNNVRYAELLKIVDDVIHYQRNEDERKALALLAEDQLPTLEELNQNKDSQATNQNQYHDQVLMSPEDIFDTFQLPDQFYLDAPGITGKIIKEICLSAKHPAPALAFASVICALGTLKAKIVTTELHSCPSNYFLCFAPTGSGKNHAQDVLTNTFKSLGVLKLISNNVASAQGVIRFLHENDAIGFYLLDEIDVFLSSLDSKYSPPYIRQVRDLLLQLYTSTNKPFHSGHTGDRRFKPIVLDKPVLNVAAYGVPQTLVDCFNARSITSGFLQRFIILTHKTTSEVNEDFTGETILSSSLRGELKEMILKANLSTEEDLIEKLELEQGVEAMKNDALVDRELVKQAKAKLQKHKQDKPDVTKMVLKMSATARSAYNAFDRDMLRLKKREEAGFTGLSGLYSRAAEQVGRLLAAMATPDPATPIELDQVDYCVTLLKSRVEAIRAFSSTQYEQSYTASYSSSLSDDMQELFRFCKKYLLKHRELKSVSYRNMLQGFKCRDARRLKEIIEGCLEIGLLCEIMVDTNKPGPRGRNFVLLSAAAKL